MTFDEALRYLLDLGHETVALKLGLDSIQKLLGALGDPQTQYASVQIAGTNGKGSTSVMLDGICRAAGIRTGLYTSPHLISITERIKISGKDIDPEEFAKLTTTVWSVASRLLKEGSLGTLPTFFEHLTAIAFLAFREAEVDVAILETGLGGRLDATTAGRARIVGITPISFDHQEYLGDSLADIAAEKAAIIRRDTSVAVVSSQVPEALAAILKRCDACGITPRLNPCKAESYEPDSEGRFTVTFKTERARYENVELGLRGRHQVSNASLAIGLAEAISEAEFSLPPEAIISGLEKARYPGRLEYIDGAPGIMLDGAHNVAGARALNDYIKEFIDQPVTMIFGAMRDKDLSGIVKELFARAKYIVLTRPDSPRSAEPEIIVDLALSVIDRSRVEIVPSPPEALRRARMVTAEKGVVFVTGSLYLVGEMRKLLVSEARGKALSGLVQACRAG